MAVPKEHHPFGLEGIHPATREKCNFYMDESDYFEALLDTPWIFDDYKQYLSPALNLDPHGIVFHDLKREEFRGGWGIAYMPNNAPQPGVLLVFANQPETSPFPGPTIIGIEWREEDKENPGFPSQWKDDFGGPLWSQ